MDMRRYKSRLHRAFRSASHDGGNVMTIFALALPLAVGAGALSVETSFEYITQTRLQVAADAAAYAGALDNRASLTLSQIAANASSVATSNGWLSASGTIQVNNPPTSGPNQNATAVEVKLSQNVPRFFTAVFSSAPVVVHARAVAIYRTAADACILALNQTASQAVNIQGNTNVNLVGCDVMSNSIANDAIHVWGSAKLSTDCAVSAGGVSNSGGLTLTGATCPSAITQAPRAHDPFAGLPIPSPGPTRNIPNGNGNGSVQQLQPGNYANGMNLRNDANLAPGVYYVSGGDFSIASNVNVTGSGVTIYLDKSSSVSIQGTSHVDLSAQQSGAYSGILFFGDPSATSGTNIFNGDGSSLLTGDLYFPTQQVSYRGNFSGKNGCMQIVADTVQWTGSTTIAVDCTGQGMTHIAARQAVKLVE
jgi:Flp pilus assembly protein TadG